MKINFLLLIILTLASINIQAFENNRIFKKVPKAPMIPKPGKGAGIKDLVFSPSEPNIIYALTQENTLYQSKNGGDQWEKVNQEGELQFKPTKLLVSTSNSQILFATTRLETNDQRLFPTTIGYQLKRSTDGGKHWKTNDFLFEKDLSIFNMPMTSLLRAVVLIDKGNSENKERRVATSSDAGETWQLSESVISDQHIDILAIDPNNSQIVYGNWKGQKKDQSQLYKSIDGGVHWSSIASGRFNPADASIMSISKIVIHPKNSNLLYRVDFSENNHSIDYQWFRSNDAGLNWQSILNEWGDSINLVIHPDDENILYGNNYNWYSDLNSITSSNLLYKSIDSGATWAFVKDLRSVNLLADSSGAVIVNPIDPDDLFAITSSSMARSQNGGLDWKLTQTGFESERPGTISVAPSNSMALYFAAKINVYPSSQEFEHRYFKSVTKGYWAPTIQPRYLS